MALKKTHHDLDVKHVACFVLTVSDTRTPKDDESGRTIVEMLEGGNHRISGYAVVPDDAAKVEGILFKAVNDLNFDVAIINGGTGISRRDSTFEAIDRILERKLPGFGEVFRFLSFEAVGPQAILSRATAGIYQGRLIFSIPGSPKAVRLAMEKILIPMLPHAVSEMRKER